MRVCHFEDLQVGNLEPLTLTRPAFELLCGCDSLGAKQRRFFKASEAGALVRPYLANLGRLLQPSTHWNDLAWLRAERTILVNSRWLPPVETVMVDAEPCIALTGDEVAYAVVGPEHLHSCCPETLDECLESWRNSLPVHQAAGRLVHYLWDLVQFNGEQIRCDHARTRPAEKSHWAGTVALVGPRQELAIDPSAQLDPMVVADTTRGPVIVEQGVVVTAFSRLEGPCYIGPHSHVLGAKIRSGTTLGPHCRIGGEVEASIVHGYSNKYHDGFLGHSYVGEWVNLGAGTQNSDLRNDYGAVEVGVNGKLVETGLTKVGCFLGDHTKTGLGTLLNTGTSVGAFCNLLPAGQLLPRYFPSFCSWWNSTMTQNGHLAGLMQTATEVMERRGRDFTEEHSALYRSLFDQTAAERQRVVFETERRRLRRSA